MFPSVPNNSLFNANIITTKCEVGANARHVTTAIFPKILIYMCMCIIMVEAATYMCKLLLTAVCELPKGNAALCTAWLMCLALLSMPLA